MRSSLSAVLPVAACLLVACASPGVQPGRAPDEVAPPLDRRLADGPPREDAAAPKSDPTSSSRVLAHVNGRAINYRDVLQRIGPEVVGVVSPEERRALEEQALLDEIRDRLVQGAAAQLEVPVAREEFDEAKAARVAEIEKSGGTLAAFLAERGLSRREFEEGIKRDIQSEKYLMAAIGRSADPAVRVPPLVDVYVSPGETRRYWDRHPELHREPATARVRMLQVRTDLSAPDREAAVAAARARAEEIRARLLAGEDPVPIYRELAAGQAEPDAMEGLVELRRGEKAPWIEEFAFGSERGAVSEVTAVRTSFFVLRAEGSHEDRETRYEDRQEEIRSLLVQVRRQVAFYDVELELLARAVVRPHSVERRLRETVAARRRKLVESYGL